MAMVVLGLGSNLGDRKDHLQQALQKIILQPIFKQIRVSCIYESDALLPAGAPQTWNKPYLNLAICGETSLEPAELLKEIKKCEQALGRQVRERWAPREIDIDILTWGDQLVTQPDLTIPHPGLLDRPFALWPLSELCPDWTYPVPGPDFKKSVQQLAKKWERTIPFETRKTSLKLNTPTPSPSGFVDKWPDSRLDRISPSEACTVARRSEWLIRGNAEDGHLSTNPQWVGIINVTPDSFSDGGLYLDSQHALNQARCLIEDGASVLDIGAESMRPGANPLDPLQEWERLLPVLKLLQEEFSHSSSGPIISVDTRHHEVAQKAINMGAHWINDVSGFDDPRMRQAVAKSSVDLVVMHHLGTPPNKDRVLPLNQNPVEVVLKWAQHRLEQLTSLGISLQRLVFDPGIGFGKTAEQSLALIQGCSRFHELGVRLLVGHSRKSFFNLFTDKPFADRDVETSIISTYLARQGVHYIRVHNVSSNVRALKVATALVQ